MVQKKEEKFRPVDVSLSYTESRSCGAGVELYCKRLESLESAAEKLKRQETAEYHKEVAALREELAGPLMQGKPTILPHHLVIIRQGLGYLVTNMRAAKGTLKAIDQTEWVDELDEIASEVEETLIPKFDEQTSLGLDGEKKKANPTGKNEEGESLRDIAEREAATAEREPATV